MVVGACQSFQSFRTILIHSSITHLFCTDLFYIHLSFILMSNLFECFIFMIFSLEKTLEYLKILESLRSKNLTQSIIYVKEYF